MTILYADDDHDDRELMSEALQKVDPSISCLTANDGQNVLDILNESSDLPDYIFLDVNMPVMDGKKCLVALKKDQRLRDIPVVIYSTTTDNTEIKQLYNLGASSFIQKPNNFSDLCSALNMFVRLVETSRQ
ncbi:response regulator [Fulvivirgaceae bacterium PWU4]|uniref:Response regulator n=1 Tax=Chryseosolibacter histidini TaxID=2782349 RepID=A0AAP2DHJ4_9BACT|nr:response regulator [Chryseosolibacter histidini]MBT1696440.1 response regulator [Chryseosolibacter histidini]